MWLIQVKIVNLVETDEIEFRHKLVAKKEAEDDEDSDDLLAPVEKEDVKQIHILTTDSESNIELIIQFKNSIQGMLIKKKSNFVLFISLLIFGFRKELVVIRRNIQD